MIGGGETREVFANRFAEVQVPGSRAFSQASRSVKPGPVAWVSADGNIEGAMCWTPQATRTCIDQVALFRHCIWYCRYLFHIS